MTCFLPFVPCRHPGRMLDISNSYRHQSLSTCPKRVKKWFPDSSKALRNNWSFMVNVDAKWSSCARHSANDRANGRLRTAWQNHVKLSSIAASPYVNFDLYKLISHDFTWQLELGFIWLEIACKFLIFLQCLVFEVPGKHWRHPRSLPSLPALLLLLRMKMHKPGCFDECNQYGVQAQIEKELLAFLQWAINPSRKTSAAPLVDATKETTKIPSWNDQRTSQDGSTSHLMLALALITCLNKNKKDVSPCHQLLTLRTCSCKEQNSKANVNKVVTPERMASRRKNNKFITQGQYLSGMPCGLSQVTCHSAHSHVSVAWQFFIPNCVLQFLLLSSLFLSFLPRFLWPRRHPLPHPPSTAHAGKSPMFRCEDWGGLLFRRGLNETICETTHDVTQTRTTEIKRYRLWPIKINKILSWILSVTSK